MRNQLLIIKTHSAHISLNHLIQALGLTQQELSGQRGQGCTALSNAIFPIMLNVEASIPILGSFSVLGRKKEEEQRREGAMPSRTPNLPQRSPADFHLHPTDQNNVTGLSLDVHYPLNKTRVVFVRKTGRTDKCEKSISVQLSNLHLFNRSLFCCPATDFALEQYPEGSPGCRLQMPYIPRSSSLISLLLLAVLKPSPTSLPSFLLLLNARP